MIEPSLFKGNSKLTLSGELEVEKTFIVREGELEGLESGNSQTFLSISVGSISIALSFLASLLGSPFTGSAVQICCIVLVAVGILLFVFFLALHIQETKKIKKASRKIRKRVCRLR